MQGYGSAFSEVIEEKTIEQIVGNDGDGVSLIKKLHEMITNEASFECEYDAVDFLHDNPPCGDYDEDGAKKFQELYTEITDKFKKETGLELEIQYHDVDDDGDCYDEVDGLYWEVFGCYVRSPEFEALRSKFGENVIERKFFVTYG